MPTPDRGVADDRPGAAQSRRSANLRVALILAVVALAFFIFGLWRVGV